MPRGSRPVCGENRIDYMDVNFYSLYETGIAALMTSSPLCYHIPRLFAPGCATGGTVWRFCSVRPGGSAPGVVRAIDVVDVCLRRYGPPVYVKHQIVHNPYVVNDLESRGAITVEEVDEVPEGSLVVFSAHGSPPEDFEKAKARNLRVIDAVCPLVTRVHNEAKKYSREGRRVLLVGHRGHQEVRGTMGQVEMTLVDDNAPEELPNWGDDEEIAVLTQTTLSVRDTAHAIESIQERFPQAVVRNDICYATTNRQEAVTKMAGNGGPGAGHRGAEQLQLQPPARGGRGPGRSGLPHQRPRRNRTRMAARQGQGGHNLGRLHPRSAGGKRHRGLGPGPRHHAQRRGGRRFLHHAPGTPVM